MSSQTERKCGDEKIDHCHAQAPARVERASPKEAVATAKDMIDSGIELLSVKSKGHLTLFLNAFKVVSPALGVVGGLLSLLLPSEPSELSQVVGKLEKLDYKIGRVQNDVKALSDNVDFGQKISRIYDPITNIELGIDYVAKFVAEYIATNATAETNTWCQCYKPFYGRKLRIF